MIRQTLGIHIFSLWSQPRILGNHSLQMAETTFNDIFVLDYPNSAFWRVNRGGFVILSGLRNKTRTFIYGLLGRSIRYSNLFPLGCVVQSRSNSIRKHLFDLEYCVVLECSLCRSLGPVPRSASQNISAEKRGYEFEMIHGTHDIKAIKLSEIKVITQDMENRPVQGVLISISGTAGLRLVSKLGITCPNIRFDLRKRWRKRLNSSLIPPARTSYELPYTEWWSR